MTKKHFIALADAIKEDGTFSEDQILTLADFCESQNPHFNDTRWRAYIKGEGGPNGGAVKTKSAEVGRRD